MEKPTRDGQQAIERWENAVKSVARARRELNSAEVELSNASVELSKWLKPEDAKEGEVFSVWWGDKLYQVDGEKVSVRAGGKVHVANVA